MAIASVPVFLVGQKRKIPTFREEPLYRRIILSASVWTFNGPASPRRKNRNHVCAAAQAEIIREAITACVPAGRGQGEFALAAGFDRVDADARPISEIPEDELLDGFGQ